MDPGGDHSFRIRNLPSLTLGFQNIIVVNQRDVRTEGMLKCLASNTELFESAEDCIAVVERALDRAGWRNDYSRRLASGALYFSDGMIGFRQLTGHFLYIDIHNFRPDIAALETTGRLSRYGAIGNELKVSPDRSPLKATARPGYSHSIFPQSKESFDLLCVGWADLPAGDVMPNEGAVDWIRQGVFLNNALDVRPIPRLPMSTGIWTLEYEFFAIGFPVLTVRVQLNMEEAGKPTARISND